MHSLHLFNILAAAATIAALPVQQTQDAQSSKEDTLILFQYDPYKKRDTDDKENTLILFQYDPYKKRDTDNKL